MTEYIQGVLEAPELDWNGTYSRFGYKCSSVHERAKNMNPENCIL